MFCIFFSVFLLMLINFFFNYSENHKMTKKKNEGASNEHFSLE